MKKILLILVCLSVGIISYGQNKEALAQIEDIQFYGIDFSKAKVFGVDETLNQFITTFESLNKLFLTEAKKYNIEKFFKKNVSKTSINEVNGLNDKIKKELFADSPDYKISHDELVRHIKALPIKGDGIGLVLVAQMLDKTNHQATYQFVFFDVATKKIIDHWEASGKAKGFGLRNYWAGSVYGALKSVKIK